MTDLRTLLSTEDKTMMSDYVTEYATGGDNGHAPIDDLLRCWNEAKGDYLYRLLGNQFMITRTLTYNKPMDKLADELARKFNSYNTACANFRKNFDRFIWDNRIALGQDYYKLQQLVNLDYLIQTAYNGDEFSVNTPDGKVIKVQKGARPMRIISRVAKAYGGIAGMEEFQNEVSIILTQKKLTGKMTLSIHPMDYMTMSHNQMDWTSCMDWTDQGCYCRGTIEMMNSPMVLVAYLASEDNDMEFRARGNYYTWNNKKWRELFIVNKDIITGVKGYPYQNSDLVQLVNSWIKELAEQNLGWSFDSTNVEYHHCNRFTYTHDKTGESISMKIRFTTDTMYNDFGSITHYALLSSDLGDNEDIEYNYSGPDMCMMCGSTGAYFEGEGYLVCEDCDRHFYCYDCGERLDEGDEYELDGEYFCYNCYQNRVAVDPLDDSEHDSERMTTVYLMSDTADPARVDWYELPTILVYNLNTSEWRRWFNDDSRSYYSGYRTRYYVTPSMFKDINDMEGLFDVDVNDWIEDTDAE